MKHSFGVLPTHGGVSRRIYYSSVGMSIVSFSSCQLSMVNPPEVSSEKMSPKVSVRVNLLLALAVIYDSTLSPSQ